MNKRDRLEFLDIWERIRLKWILLRIEHVVTLVRAVVKYAVP